MTPLVECYEPENLLRVIESGATLIGINNRDLRTFETDLQHTIRLRSRIPENLIMRIINISIMGIGFITVLHSPV